MKTISSKIEEFKSIQKSYERLSAASDILMEVDINSDLPESDNEIDLLTKAIYDEMYRLQKRAIGIQKQLHN